MLYLHLFSSFFHFRLYSTSRISDIAVPRFLYFGLPAFRGLHLDAEGVVFPGGVEQQEVGDSGYHSLVFELLPGDAVPASAVGDCEKQPPPCVVLEAEPAHAAALQPMFFVPGRAARLFLLLFLQVLFVGH